MLLRCCGCTPRTTTGHARCQGTCQATATPAGAAGNPCRPPAHRTGEDTCPPLSQGIAHVVSSNGSTRLEQQPLLRFPPHPLLWFPPQVRFFERRKLLRRLASLKATIADNGAAPTPLQASQLRSLQADLQYVTHFPPGEKYVSLLVDADSPEAREVQQRQRTRLRALVNAQQAERALLQEADEGLQGGLRDGQVADELHGDGDEEGEDVDSTLGDAMEDGVDGSDNNGDKDDSEGEGKHKGPVECPPKSHAGQPAQRIQQHSTGPAKRARELTGTSENIGVHGHPSKTANHPSSMPIPVAAGALPQAVPSDAFDDEFFLQSDDEGVAHAPLPPLTLPRQDMEHTGRKPGRGLGRGRGRGEVTGGQIWGRGGRGGRYEGQSGHPRGPGRGARAVGRGHGMAPGRSPAPLMAAREPAPKGKSATPTRTRAEGGRKRKKKD